MMSTYDRINGGASLNQTYLMPAAQSLPLGWGDSSEFLGDTIMEKLIKQTLDHYDKKYYTNLSLLESSAVACLREVYSKIDIFEMEALSFIKYLSFYKFPNKRNRTNWNSIWRLYETCLAKVV